EHVILDEELFLKTLSVERKRTERSGKPFELILIDGFEALQVGNLEETALNAVSSAICDIDVTGWYATGSCLGIICVELGDNYRVGASNPIVASIESALRGQLTPSQYA